MNRNVDVVFVTPRGSLRYNADVDDRVPLPLIGEHVVLHEQSEAMRRLLDLTTTTSMVMTTPGKLRGKMPRGLSVMIEKGSSLVVPFIENRIPDDIAANLSNDERTYLDQLFSNECMVIDLTARQ